MFRQRYKIPPTMIPVMTGPLQSCHGAEKSLACRHREVCGQAKIGRMRAAGAAQGQLFYSSRKVLCVRRSAWPFPITLQQFARAAPTRTHTCFPYLIYDPSSSPAAVLVKI